MSCAPWCSRERYAEIAKRLRQADFEVHKNASGNPVVQTWKIRGSQQQLVTVDFLISPSEEEDRPSEIKHLEGNFGAVITPGLELAFDDRELISMEGVTIMGEQATPRPWGNLLKISGVNHLLKSQV